MSTHSTHSSRSTHSSHSTHSANSANNSTHSSPMGSPQTLNSEFDDSKDPFEHQELDLAPDPIDPPPHLTTTPNTSQPPSTSLADSLVLDKLPEMALLTVSEPQRKNDNSSKQHVTYLITSQLHSSSQVLKVRRRFSQFHWLHKLLSEEFPACVIPPLPDKKRMKYISGDRFSPEFTVRRAFSLERFLLRISHHPLLNGSKLFKDFLDPDSSIPLLHYQAPTVKPISAVPQSAISSVDKISDSVMNAFTKIKQTSNDMIEAKRKAESLERSMTSLERNAIQNSKTNTDIALELKKIVQYSSQLANIQKNDSSEYRSLAASGKLFSSIAYDLARGTNGEYMSLISDMVHYAQALKGMLRQRELRQIDYEVLVDYLDRTKAELENVESGSKMAAFSTSFLRNKVTSLVGMNDSNRSWAVERAEHLKEKCATLTDECEDAKKNSEKFEEFAKNEFRIFEAILAMELRECLRQYADLHISYYEHILTSVRGMQD